DPGLFGLDIKFTFGAGPILKTEAVEAIRRRAAELSAEYRAGQDKALREKYLRIIDSRLVQNPRVAFKVLHRGGVSAAEHTRAAERFSREDGALRRVNHRNIIRRYGRLEDPTLGPCLMIEHVEGRTLDEVLRRQREKGQGPLPLAAVAHVAYQLAHALQHCHQHGVVHGDVKPQNILSERPSAEDVAKKKLQGAIKLLDFGLSHPIGGAAPARVEGTIPFVAPEQLRHQPLTALTDVYQLGMTLFVLATSRLPYEGLSPDEFRKALATADPHPMRVHHLRPDVSPRFEALIEGARDKDPGKRWSLDKVLEELAQIYSAREFTVQSAKRANIAEELLARAQTNAAIKDFFRAVEALELAADFLDAVSKDRADEVRARHQKLLAQYEPHRKAVAELKRIQKEHIFPVDALMEELYHRYGKGLPLLTDDEKGVVEELDGDTKIIKRSLIDGILGHTHQAIEALGRLDGDLIGDMHRKMVDRAASQEVACSDLVAREIQFGDDYRKATSS
ncbi:MAG TPA: protein kinase, partial [Planctomycetota bacterium]|nr:protein kinase [Planctomycetota bacterium]